MNILFKNKSV